jgi:hypothetical protein
VRIEQGIDIHGHYVYPLAVWHYKPLQNKIKKSEQASTNGKKKYVQAAFRQLDNDTVKSVLQLENYQLYMTIQHTWVTSRQCLQYKQNLHNQDQNLSQPLKELLSALSKGAFRVNFIWIKWLIWTLNKLSVQYPTTMIRAIYTNFRYGPEHYPTVGKIF